MPRHFDLDLDRLRERLLRMAGTIEAMIDSCLTALRTLDRHALDQAFQREHEVNEFHRAVSENVVVLIARHQPVADDLRLLIAILKISIDLERIGDQTVNLSRKMLDLADSGIDTVLRKLESMLDAVRTMVARAVDAFVRQDVAAAEQVIRSDESVDTARDEATRAIIEAIPGERTAVCALVEALLAARNIERIGDHATNVAEDVIYLVQGRDVSSQLEGSSHEKPGSWRQIRHISSAPAGGSNLPDQ